MRLDQHVGVPVVDVAASVADLARADLLVHPRGPASASCRCAVRWLDETGGPVELRHRDCGQPVNVQLRCAAEHHVSADDLDLAPCRKQR